MCRNKLRVLIGAILLVIGAPVHAAMIQMTTDTPEGSSVLPGEMITVALEIVNPENQQVISTQATVAYPSEWLEVVAVELNETLFDVALPKETEEGRITIGGGSTKGGSRSTEIPLGTMTLRVIGEGNHNAMLRLDHDTTSIMVAETEGVADDYQESNGVSIVIGDYIPPTTAPTPVPTRTLRIEEEETGSGSILHNAAEEMEEVGEVIMRSTLAAPEQIQYRTMRNEVKLQWNAVEGAAYYYVYWSDNDRDFVHRAKVSAPYFQQDGLARGKERLYVLTAVSINGIEGASSVAVPVTVGVQKSVNESLPKEVYVPSAPAVVQTSLPVKPSAPALPQTGGALLLLIGVLGAGFGICKAFSAAR